MKRLDVVAYCAVRQHALSVGVLSLPPGSHGLAWVVGEANTSAKEVAFMTATPYMLPPSQEAPALVDDLRYKVLLNHLNGLPRLRYHGVLYSTCKVTGQQRFDVHGYIFGSAAAAARAADLRAVLQGQKPRNFLSNAEWEMVASVLGVNEQQEFAAAGVPNVMKEAKCAAILNPPIAPVTCLDHCSSQGVFTSTGANEALLAAAAVSCSRSNCTWEQMSQQTQPQQQQAQQSLQLALYTQQHQVYSTTKCHEPQHAPLLGGRSHQQQANIPTRHNLQQQAFLSAEHQQQQQYMLSCYQQHSLPQYQTLLSASQQATPTLHQQQASSSQPSVHVHCPTNPSHGSWPASSSNGLVTAPGPGVVQHSPPSAAAGAVPLVAAGPSEAQVNSIQAGFEFRISCKCSGTKDEWSSLQLVINEGIGGGQNGMVFKATVISHTATSAAARKILAASGASHKLLRPGKIVALKVHRMMVQHTNDVLIDMLTSRQYTTIGRLTGEEYSVMVKAAANYVIKCYAVGLGISPQLENALSVPVVVQEYADLGSVEQLTHKHGLDFDKGAPLEAEIAYPIIKDVAMGLLACHTAGVAVRDLKAANVLLKTADTPTGRVAKICDFGSAADQLRTGQLRGTTMVGTPVYEAPEGSIAGEKHDARTDVYSFGMMLLVMRLGLADPFVHWQGLSSFRDVSKARAEDIATRRIEVVEYIHSEVLYDSEVDFVKRCLSLATERPTIVKLLQEPYLMYGPCNKRSRDT